MKPLLAHVYEPRRVQYPCFCQPKLNGIRALYQSGHFQSRDEIPFPSGLLDHLAKPLLEIFGEQHAPLDGELYVHGWALQRINAAVTPVRQKPMADTLEVQYHIFDVVDYSKSFIERISIFDGFLHSNYGKIRAVPTDSCGDEASLNMQYARWVKEGYEGIMLRLGDCPYTTPKQLQSKLFFGQGMTSGPNGRLKFLSDKDNRAWHLLKRKSWLDEDFLCVGVEEGEGKYQGAVGALKCEVLDLDKREKKSFSVSGGLSNMQRDKYWDHPELVIGKKIKVKFLCYSEDGIPLNPTILLIP